MKNPVSVLGLALACLGPGATALEAAESKCRRASAEHLLWVHSGDWVGQRLVLGDVGAGALAVLELPGLIWSKVSHPGEGPLEFNKPLVIPSEGPGVLVAADSRIVRLDESLRPIKGYRLDAAVEGARDVGNFGVHVAFQDRALGFFYFQKAEDEYRQGISVLAVEPKIQLEMLREVSVTSNEFRSALLSLSSGTVLGERFYWLGMDAEAFILQVDAGKSKRLNLVPSAWRRAPTFPAGGGPSTVRADNALREKLSFPAGLYSQGKELFILHHGPEKTGKRWSLAAVDPEKPDTHRMLTLPTRSNWVTVVPGPEYWAILEQGPVLGPATQTTTSVLLVPSAWFSAPDSPLTKPGAEAACGARP